MNTATMTPTAFAANLAAEGDLHVIPQAPAIRTITPNEDQQNAIQLLLDYVSDADPVTKYFVLSGYAGTGKTFIMREVVARCAKSFVKFAFTAPTNKAAKELRKVTGDAGTIFALLGLRIDKSGEVKTLIAGKAPNDLSDIDVIVLDEGGMANSHLVAVLEAQCAKYNVKLIIMADEAQLPPVGEAASPIWAWPINVSLTKVMRHDNEILALVTEIRKVVHSPAPSITIRSNHSNGQGVWKQSKMEFKQSIYQAAANGDFADGNKSKVISWRNAKVEEYNSIIRAAIFGAEAQPGFYLLGDHIVAAAPCLRGDATLMTTDEEAIVEGVVNCPHPLEPKYAAIELKCRTELNKIVRLLVIHPSAKQQYENDSQNLAHAAKQNPKMWKAFWQHKELFHDVKYAYALTTHRSQGSTYENVWVDYQDILLNRNRKEAFQCLYVACSRPTTCLYLA